jgi:hypothetical protein
MPFAFIEHPILGKKYRQQAQDQGRARRRPENLVYI